MVYLLGLLAAMALGVGYVLQQHVAMRSSPSQLLHFRLLLDLMRVRLWWAGMVSIVGGQCLSALALLFGGVATVEPLLSVSLLIAFAVAAAGRRLVPHWQEVLGALLMTGALTAFLTRNATQDAAITSSALRTTLGTACTAAFVLVLVAVARRRSASHEALILAAAAGVLYGLQDVATRGALVRLDRNGLLAMLVSPWPYIVLGCGLFGILLSQSAFGAARLDFSLPPATAAEPVVAIALGAAMLGADLRVDARSLVVDAACFVALLASVVLIGRSPALGPRDQPG